MDPIDYLTSRVAAIDPDSEKSVALGAKLIAEQEGWLEVVGELVSDALEIVGKHSQSVRRATNGTAMKLTYISIAIGDKVGRRFGVEWDIRKSIRVGDILLEALLQDGVIVIEKEYDGFRAPYVVRLNKLHNSLPARLSGTIFAPPEPITGLVSPISKDKFIKGWKDPAKFKRLLASNPPFVRALEKVRQQAWSLNQAVFKAAKDNPPQRVLEIVSPDGEIVQFDVLDDRRKSFKGFVHLDTSEFMGARDPRVQRVLSRYYEYNQIMAKAQKIGEKTFYQEVSCDYRGRIYFSEPFLEFQGGDLARSLFLFHNKEPVTNQGYKWLCIHAANSYNASYSLDELAEQDWTEYDYASHLRNEGLESISVDKMTLRDKLNWTVRHMKSVIEWASRGSVRAEAESPYAFLAVSKEILGYLTAAVGNRTYYSGLPVPSDGSNNGWQHLAAMSKDKEAGELVSLVPQVIQKDFYVAVAKQMIELKPEWFQEHKMPMKHIRKGISKRGSMTRAYSAGRKKIALNMYDDCHVEGFLTKYNIQREDTDMLAKCLVEAIDTVCAGPLKTAKFLQEIASFILGSGTNQISWVTPSGFPVAYKHNLQRGVTVKGFIKGATKDGKVFHVTRQDVIAKDTGEIVPCRKGFASGISPNFVHSMDAAHLALCIDRFRGSFAPVHDSFAVHPDKVEGLQAVAKETFVAIYNHENFFEVIKKMLLGDQAKAFEKPHPPVGDLDISGILRSDYFFC